MNEWTRPSKSVEGTRDGHMIKFLNQVVSPLLKIFRISTNHADPDEMLHSTIVAGHVIVEPV